MIGYPLGLATILRGLATILIRVVTIFLMVFPAIALAAALALNPTTAHARTSDDTSSCIQKAATTYGIDARGIRRIIDYHATHPSGVGIMGVPEQWLPYLAEYGISAGAVQTSDCQNIIAGAWIMAYTRQVQSTLHQYSNPMSLPVRAAQWKSAIAFYAQASGVPVSVINAVIMQESGFNPSARSSAGAIGLMQLMPDTARSLGVDPYNPIDNLRGGIAYLRDLSAQFGGNLPLVLAAYNAGPGAVVKYNGIPPYHETQDYVASITRRLKGIDRQIGAINGD